MSSGFLLISSISTAIKSLFAKFNSWKKLRSLVFKEYSNTLLLSGVSPNNSALEIKSGIALLII